MNKPFHNSSLSIKTGNHLLSPLRKQLQFLLDQSLKLHTVTQAPEQTSLRSQALSCSIFCIFIFAFEYNLLLLKKKNKENRKQMTINVDYSQKNTNRMTRWPSFIQLCHFWGHTQRISIPPQRVAHHDYYSSIHKAREWNQRLIKRWVNAGKVLHRHNGTSFSQKEKWNYKIFRTIDECGNYFKQSNPDAESGMLMFSLICRT